MQQFLILVVRTRQVSISLNWEIMLNHLITCLAAIKPALKHGFNIDDLAVNNMIF